MKHSHFSGMESLSDEHREKFTDLAALITLIEALRLGGEGDREGMRERLYAVNKMTGWRGDNWSGVAERADDLIGWLLQWRALIGEWGDEQRDRQASEAVAEAEAIIGMCRAGAPLL